MRIWYTDLRRVLTRPSFLLAVGLFTVMLYVSGFDAFLDALNSREGLTAGIHVQLLRDALSSGWIFFSLPLLSALPFSASFLEDMSSRYILFLLSRGRFRTYISARFGICALVGALIPLLGITLAYVIMLLLLRPMETTGVGIPLAVLFGPCSMCTLCGMLWSCTGLVLSVLTNSHYLAWAGPFVFDYFLVILCERYYPKLYVLYPKVWLQPDSRWPLGYFGVLIFLLILLFFLFVVFATAADRRLHKL